MDIFPLLKFLVNRESESFQQQKDFMYSRYLYYSPRSHLTFCLACTEEKWAELYNGFRLADAGASLDARRERERRDEFTFLSLIRI